MVCTASCSASEAPKYPWFAIYVKSRHEKAVSRALDSRNHEQFTPLYARRNGGRTVELPLFPSYVFSRIDPNNRLPVLEISGVFFIVGSGSRMAEVDEREIAAIRAVAASHCEMSPCDYLREGQRIHFSSGPLRGLEGIYDGRKRDEAIVSVTLLQRSVAVKINPKWLASGCEARQRDLRDKGE